MKSRKSLTLLCVLCCMACLPAGHVIQAQTSSTSPVKPAELQVFGSPFPMRVLIQSPADTNTDLQIICLFQSSPENTLHGSLLETNQKLTGLLGKLRSSSLFRGDLGETLFIIPPAGTIAAKKLLIIGLGDSATFTPQRLNLVGSIAFNESNRLGVAHPFFAPTILDGGVTRFTTGEVAENFVAGFLRAARTEKILQAAVASPGQFVQDLTFLAGPTHAPDTRQGIEKALASK